MSQTPSVPEPAPGIYVPQEVPPLNVPNEPAMPPEVQDLPPAEPTIPVREPGKSFPAQA